MPNRFSGKQHRGFMQQKRDEAEARNAETPPTRRKQHRLAREHASA